jgi:hypothetical protein
LIKFQNINSDRVTEAIPNNKVADLIKLIHSGMQDSGVKSAPSKKQKALLRIT